MNKLVTSAVFALCLFASSAAFAGEKTVTLAVQNMYYAACPHTVKASLEAVPGVAKVCRILPGQDGDRDLRRYQDRRDDPD
jgi:periplasmic mercuric ion binding protein